VAPRIVARRRKDRWQADTFGATQRGRLGRRTGSRCGWRSRRRWRRRLPPRVFDSTRADSPGSPRVRWTRGPLSGLRAGAAVGESCQKRLPATHTHLLARVIEVILDGIDGESQPSRDPLPRFPPNHQQENLPLTWRTAVSVRERGRRIARGGRRRVDGRRARGEELRARRRRGLDAQRAGRRDLASDRTADSVPEAAGGRARVRARSLIGRPTTSLSVAVSDALAQCS
jgi:hypothetical protein